MIDCCTARTMPNKQKDREERQVFSQVFSAGGLRTCRGVAETKGRELRYSSIQAGCNDALPVRRCQEGRNAALRGAWGDWGLCWQEAEGSPPAPKAHETNRAKPIRTPQENTVHDRPSAMWMHRLIPPAARRNPLSHAASPGGGRASRMPALPPVVSNRSPATSQSA